MCGAGVWLCTPSWPPASPHCLHCLVWPGTRKRGSTCNTFRKAVGDLQESDSPPGNTALSTAGGKGQWWKLGPQTIPLSFTSGLFQGVLSKLSDQIRLCGLRKRRLISEGKSSMIFKWHHSNLTKYTKEPSLPRAVTDENSQFFLCFPLHHTYELLLFSICQDIGGWPTPHINDIFSPFS